MTMQKNCILALDAGGTFLKAGLFDRNGALLPFSSDREPVNSDGTLCEVHNAYSALIGRMKTSAGVFGYRIAGASVDIPGPFDYRNGISRMRHKYTAIYGVSLIPWFRELLGDIHLLFLHDSAAFLSGVAQQHPECRNIAGVMIGTGLGFALMRDGSILSDENGSPLISLYRCPFRDGIAEDYISARGILRRYNAVASEQLQSGKEIGDLAERGTEPAKSIYAETGDLLGELLCPILKEFRTEALYLGGQISKSFPVFEKPLSGRLSSVPTLCFIEAAKDIDSVHLNGAAMAYLNQFSL